MRVSRQPVPMSRVRVLLIRVNVEWLRPVDANEQRSKHNPQPCADHSVSLSKNAEWVKLGRRRLWPCFSATTGA